MNFIFFLHPSFRDASLWICFLKKKNKNILTFDLLGLCCFQIALGIFPFIHSLMQSGVRRGVSLS